MFLYPVNPKSQGAKKLAKSLGIKRIRHKNSRFKGLRAPWVINWGACAIDTPWEQRVRFLNAPEAVQEVSNKLTFFCLLDDAGESHLGPEWTPNIDEAQEWLEKGITIVERHVLNGHGGQGIRIVSKNAIEEEHRELQKAPLYVRYIPKKAEYRVHIVNGKVIDIAQKVARAEIKPFNWRVRSHNNGFVYQRENIMAMLPDEVVEVALQCMRLTDLDFGAVDVIWNFKHQRAYVLEINTAPGLEGSTVESYANAFRRWK